ncbi:hypothetical protein VP1G_09953 [Cytospora mali]|uniref:MINDY deubiquitinase domain-containing protein n=1 Tax=Cytospora mali TaxID=578113 RepID=A0A194VGB8_CYTMA|nr:hypothetical protein VP1G_09953 [Valsa mali var. pyri (nom. inval.)]
MVTRKPLPKNATIHPSIAPRLNMEGISGEVPTSEKPKATLEQQMEHAADSDADSWERDTDSEDDEEAPPTYHDGTEEKKVTKEQEIGSLKGVGNGGINVLQPAVTGGSDENVSQTPSSTRSGPGTETNPFRRNMSHSSGQHSVVVPAIPTAPPPPLPPSEDLSKLSLNEASKNPWQPALDDQRSLAPSTLSTAADQEPVQNIWASQVPSRAASTGPASQPPSIPPLAPEEKASWGDDLPEKSSITVPPSFRTSLEDHELEVDSHAWDDVAVSDKGKAPMKPPPFPGTVSEYVHEGEESLIDFHEGSASGSSGGLSQPSVLTKSQPPGLPPRSVEKAPAAPQTSASGEAETYQVKNVNWHDAITSQNLRKSPILIQNANGPCPLMALVNALTLTTPEDAQDAVLVNTLKTREQISLDLLLNAVFDELMSERRTTPDQSLPDVTELYAFLKGLHTGMNVNPRFIPTDDTERNLKRTSLTHLHPTERDVIPGTFEDTKEMSFYKIFQVPLIHGWLPLPGDPVYDAMKRQAESYEDAQNILFREEELDDKLSSPTGEGLSEEEQVIYQDIMSIKSFLQTSATQLTPWGLEVISKATRPGSVAILFRNDHFSTLYRHPQTLQLFALVTDAGYAGHDEIVWESLFDVNGERSEFFSGDFLVIGGPQASDDAASGSASASTGQEWTTVQNNKGKNKSQVDAPALSPKEQEDRDLALALQLQEEEDQRHRNEQAQRRREAQLSEQFIEQQAVRRGPASPRQSGNNVSVVTGQRTSSVRGGGASRGRGGAQGAAPRPVQQQVVRPLVPPAVRSRAVNRPADDDADDAPPPYEDAARQTPYVPPAGHPSHPNSSPSPSLSGPTPSNSTSRLPASRGPGPAVGPSPVVQAPVGVPFEGAADGKIPKMTLYDYIT